MGVGVAFEVPLVNSGNEPGLSAGFEPGGGTGLDIDGVTNAFDIGQVTVVRGILYVLALVDFSVATVEWCVPQTTEVVYSGGLKLAVVWLRTWLVVGGIGNTHECDSGTVNVLQIVVELTNTKGLVEHLWQL